MHNENTTVQQVSLSLIDTQKLLLRDIDQQAVTDLTYSIQKHGVLQPIQLRTKQDGRYEVVFGNHRHEASKRAGLSLIPASIKNYTEKEALLLALAENTQRVEMSPVKEGEIYVRLLNNNYSTASLIALAQEIGKSIDYIKTRIAIARNLNPILKNQIGKTLTLTNAEALSKQPMDQQEDIYKRMQQVKLRPNQTNQEFFSQQPTNREKPAVGYCKCPTCGIKHLTGIKGMM
jgi:ParB family transcriptional regulator, chromosome partitioning protein